MLVQVGELPPPPPATTPLHDLEGWIAQADWLYGTCNQWLRRFEGRILKMIIDTVDIILRELYVALRGTEERWAREDPSAGVRVRPRIREPVRAKPSSAPQPPSEQKREAGPAGITMRV